MDCKCVFLGFVSLICVKWNHQCKYVKFTLIYMFGIFFWNRSWMLENLENGVCFKRRNVKSLVLRWVRHIVSIRSTRIFLLTSGSLILNGKRHTTKTTLHNLFDFSLYPWFKKSRNFKIQYLSHDTSALLSPCFLSLKHCITKHLNSTFHPFHREISLYLISKWTLQICVKVSFFFTEPKNRIAILFK